MTQAPTWEKDRLPGIRTLLRALGEGKVDAAEQILARWTWKLARATRKAQDRRASAEFPEAKRLLGALANSRGHRHEENAGRLVQAALAQPLPVGVALLASAEGYTPRANKLIDEAREQIAPLSEVAAALAENLPAPKAAPSKRRRRRRKKKGGPEAQANGAAPAEAVNGAAPDGDAPTGEGEAASPTPRRRRRRRSSARANGDGAAPVAAGAEADTPAEPVQTDG